MVNWIEQEEKRREANNKLNAFDAKAIKDDERETVEAWKKVLETKEGRTVLASICSKGRVFGMVFGREMDAQSLAYYSGRREMATIIYGQASKASPELVLKMFNERNEIEAKRAEKRQVLIDDLNNCQE